MAVQKPSVYIIAGKGHLSDDICRDLYEVFSLNICDSINDVPGDNDDPKRLLQAVTPVLLFVEQMSITDIEVALTPLFIDSQKVVKRQPVLFVCSAVKLSSIANLLSSLDAVLPCNSLAADFIFILNQLVQRSNEDKKLKRDLKEASDIALLSMSHSSELGEISRFILESYKCLIYEDLFASLFNTLEFFGLECSALIMVDDTVTMSASSGVVSSETKDLMLEHHRAKRVSSLENDVIISYEHGSIMLHNIVNDGSTRSGRLTDNMAVLGHCFNARVSGIYTEQKALAAGRAKTMFLATMSHELRTPMNSVIGYTGRLIKKLDGRLSEREAKQLDAIRRNGEHLLNLINDILDLSKIEVGQMEVYPERMDIIVLIKDIFDQLRPLAATSKLGFELIVEEEHLEIDVDKKRFIQMVMNLVSNGIKYTKEGGVKITLSTVNDKHVGEAVAIAIQDTGIGISEEDQKKLFGNFIQIDSALSRTVEGSGLGLAISVFFAKRHEGRINVESTLGEGSCFTLLLPRPV